MADLKDPYRDLLPPLKTSERDALQADIAAGGVHAPVLVTEDGVILDGHNRIDCDPGAPVKVLPGSAEWSEALRMAFVYGTATKTRNMTPEQWRAYDKDRKRVALRLKEEGHTQEKIAELFGVARQTVSDWLTSNAGTGNACVPDARVKLPRALNPIIVDRLDAGETETQIAADLGVTRQRINQIAKKERAKAEEAEARAAARVDIPDGLIVGDFRERASVIPDNSVDLVFTDPPYLRETAHLYADAAKEAARILKPGGSMLAYCGAFIMPHALDLMREHLRYWWTCGVFHTGNRQYMNEYGIIVGWKPILWMVKDTRADRDVMVLDVVSGGREKDTHEWQQAEGEAIHFLENLTQPGDLVVDFFAGSGTTAAAAKRTGRRWVTFEIDELAAKAAADRINAVPAP